MHLTIRETFRLRPGDTIEMSDGTLAEVLRVNSCSASIREHVTKTVTVGERTFTATRGQVARISPNSECKIVNRRHRQAPQPPIQDNPQLDLI